MNSKWLGILVVQYKLMEETEAGDEEMQNNTLYERVRCLSCSAMFSLLWSVHGTHQKYLGVYVV